MKITLKLILSFILLTTVLACKDDDDTVTPVVVAPTPAEILSSVKWKTTIVKDSTGSDVTQNNMGFVGLSEFKSDGTFTITELDGKPRSSGTWALTPDGKKRILVTATFTRVTDIVTLNANLFIYRVGTPAGTVTVEHVPYK